MNIWYVFSVFMHIVCAAFWIGGMLFLPLVVLPGIKQHPDRIAILYKTGVTFRFYGWIALVVLLLTGLLNVHLRGLSFTWAFFTQSSYGVLLGYKLVVFSLILLVSGVHDFFFGKKALEQMQTSDNSQFKLIARWSGRIGLLLSLAMVFMGVILSRGGVF